MKTLLSWLLTCTAVLAANALTPARAEDYPTRPLRVITANSAGGTSDIFVRALSEKLQVRLGQPVIVENRPGGAMIIAGRACADAANDGYTICLLPNETLTLKPLTTAHFLAWPPALSQKLRGRVSEMSAISAGLRVKRYSDRATVSVAL